MDQEKKDQILWKKFQEMDSHQVFLYLYLLHKPDYAYNIAKTLKKLKENRSVELYKLKTLTQPHIVSAILNKMKKEKLIYISTKKKSKGRYRKFYEINTEVYSILLHSHFPDADIWHDYVIDNLIKNFRILVPKDYKNRALWISEIDKIPDYNYITLICYIYDQIVKNLGFAYLWQKKVANEYETIKKEECLQKRDQWIKRIKTTGDQEYKKEKINQTFEKLIEIKKIKTFKTEGKTVEYTPLEYQKDMIKEQIYKNLEHIISNIRETLLEVIALTKKDTYYQINSINE